jgi:uncharacterized protein (TIGR02145 family)
LEEIKVRWKKAALENCTGAPCIIIPPPPSFTCGTSTISDIDNNSYNTVLIGTQCWTKTNLKVTKYNDESNIPEINSAGTWNNTIVTGARTVYNDLPANLSTYGYLYNWYAATDSRKICPAGWHVPTDGEWTSLIQFIDPTASASANPQSTTAGGKMKSTSLLLWISGSSGTDDYGFTGLPGGGRNTASNFLNINGNAYLWSATGVTSNAWFRALNLTNSDVQRITADKSDGLSVRCLRD